MLGGVAIVLPRANVAAERIWEVITTEPSIRDPEPDPNGQPSESQATGVSVEFDHVSFRYDSSGENVLEDVSFVAEPGKTTAIVGATGCGKSTVVQLIERFYDVSDGAVRVDGVDVRDVPVDHLRGQFGYVPQKAFLFSGTVGSNVAYSDSEMGAGRIEAALEIAQAKDFVDGLPGGLEAPIAQGGTNVSGGQRQRLAIARALARDARGYLFDDSFSALDYKTDAALRAELNTRLGGSTVLIVAQRIATIMYADKIVCLSEGRVMGQGTHAELLATCPEYRDIAASQFSEEELQAALVEATGSLDATAAPNAEGAAKASDAEGGER